MKESAVQESRESFADVIVLILLFVLLQVFFQVVHLSLVRETDRPPSVEFESPVLGV